MNFFLVFPLILLASICLVAATTAFAIWVGFLPGVEMPFARKRTGQTFIKKFYGEVPEIDSVGTIVTALFETFPEKSANRFVKIIPPSDINAILAEASNSLTSMKFAPIKRVYRLKNETKSQWIAETT